MTTVEDYEARRTEAFTHARDIVQDWRQSGRRTTTAGVTSMMKQLGVLDLEDLGLSANKEFWEHAAASGIVNVGQQSNGHWFVLLPGEDLAAFDVPVTTAARTVVPNDADVRLKSDVWTSFVDWNPAFRRFWDRSHGRAFMAPTSPGWIPEDVDAARFIEIHPALQDTQIGWMRSFADDNEEPDRTALHVSLANHAPRGAFRRELRDRGLGRAWRDTLRAHILDEAVKWARSNGVDVAAIMETRHREAEVSSSRPLAASRGLNSDSERKAPEPQVGAFMRASAAERPGAGGAVSPRVSPVEPDAREAATLDRVDLLRMKLHKVIDRMSWDELTQLPLRAEYLLDS